MALLSPDLLWVGAVDVFWYRSWAVLLFELFGVSEFSQWNLKPSELIPSESCALSTGFWKYGSGREFLVQCDPQGQSSLPLKENSEILIPTPPHPPLLDECRRRWGVRDEHSQLMTPTGSPVVLTPFSNLSRLQFHVQEIHLFSAAPSDLFASLF